MRLIGKDNAPLVKRGLYMDKVKAIPAGLAGLCANHSAKRPHSFLQTDRGKMAAYLANVLYENQPVPSEYLREMGNRVVLR